MRARDAAEQLALELGGAAVFYLLRNAETGGKPAAGGIVQPIVTSAP